MAKEKPISPQTPPLTAIAAGSLERIVPKYCTTINIAVLNTKNLIMTLLYSDPTGDVTLIDRIIVDMDHAKALHDILGKVITDVEKGTIEDVILNSKQ